MSLPKLSYYTTVFILKIRVMAILIIQTLKHSFHQKQLKDEIKLASLMQISEIFLYGRDILIR